MVPIWTTSLRINNSSICIFLFRVSLTVNRDYLPKQNNQLIFVMVKCSVIFAVRTEFFNII
jgi:hypothetical protein